MCIDTFSYLKWFSLLLQFAPFVRIPYFIPTKINTICVRVIESFTPTDPWKQSSNVKGNVNNTSDRSRQANLDFEKTTGLFLNFSDRILELD